MHIGETSLARHGARLIRAGIIALVDSAPQFEKDSAQLSIGQQYAVHSTANSHQ